MKQCEEKECILLDFSQIAQDWRKCVSCVEICDKMNDDTFDEFYNAVDKTNHFKNSQFINNQNQRIIRLDSSMDLIEAPLCAKARA